VRGGTQILPYLAVVQHRPAVLQAVCSNKKIVASLARLLDDTLDYLMMENHISSGCYLLPQPTKAALFCSVESGLDELARRTNWESSLLRLYVPLATCKRFPAVARKS
jgi:hypothetical protein